MSSSSQALPRQRRPDVGQGDLLPLVQHASLQPGCVHKVAARDQRLDVLDAELQEAVRGGDFLFAEAVVVPHLVAVAVFPALDPDVAEAVKLRAHLSDLPGHELVVVDQPVGPEGTASRTTRNRQREAPRAEQRHPGFVRAAQSVDPAVAHQLDRVAHLLRRDPVRRPCLVARTPP